jgi:hypothetical protein
MVISRSGERGVGVFADFADFADFGDFADFADFMRLLGVRFLGPRRCDWRALAMP